MSTKIWPPIAPDELKKAEADTLVRFYLSLAFDMKAPINTTQARELAWLLDHTQETLAGFKEALEECKALLAPIEPGSTLAMSSVRSEIVKGYINRVGTMIVKGVSSYCCLMEPPANLLAVPRPAIKTLLPDPASNQYDPSAHP